MPYYSVINKMSRVDNVVISRRLRSERRQNRVRGVELDGAFTVLVMRLIQRCLKGSLKAVSLQLQHFLSCFVTCKF